MIDQASSLRDLIHTTAATTAEPITRAKRGTALALTSGKGGVGKSTLALLIAMELRKLGQSVCVLDAHESLDCLAMMCGLRRNAKSISAFTPDIELKDLLLEGPSGIQLLCDAADLIQNSVVSSNIWNDLQASFDFILIDTPTGYRKNIETWNSFVDHTVLVATPDSLSVTDVYVGCRQHLAAGLDNLQLIVNRANEPEATRIMEAINRTSTSFFSKQFPSLGSIPNDPELPRTFLQRQRYVVHRPNISLQRATHRLAESLLKLPSRNTFQESHSGSSDEKSTSPNPLLN